MKYAEVSLTNSFKVLGQSFHFHEVATSANKCTHCRATGFSQELNSGSPIVVVRDFKEKKTIQDT